MWPLRVDMSRISMQNTSTHYGTGPWSKSLWQVPATSPLVCADLWRMRTTASIFFASVFGYENNKPKEPSTVTVFPNIVLLQFNAWSYPVIITNPLIWYKHKNEVSKSIVNWGDWLQSPANIKRANKDAKIYVGRSTTVLDLLFCAHTLCMNYVTNTFQLGLKIL